MALSLNQFARLVADSGLLSVEDIKAALHAVPAEQRPKDGQELAHELVRQGQLTKFQAQAVYRGQTKGPVLGEYAIRDKIGASGMGKGLKAPHRRMERAVALQVLPAGTATEELFFTQPLGEPPYTQMEIHVARAGALPNAAGQVAVPPQNPSKSCVRAWARASVPVAPV